MKNIKKIICLILIVIITLNVFLPSFTFASNTDSLDPLIGIGKTLLDGVFGILTYPFKLTIIAPGLVANLILTEIASVGSGTIEVVTLESILFNQLALTDVNILHQSSTASGETVSTNIQEIRQNVANWYFAFRNLAIVTSLATLVYIGIRMAISSIAEDKAKYKKMLANWAVRFCFNFCVALFYVICIKC